MAFGITPAPSPDAEFELVAVPPVAPTEEFPEFVQWQINGTALGAPDVLIVDFVGTNIEATRGVGENSHVITVRELIPPPPPPEFFYYTSHPYAYEAVEELALGLSLPVAGQHWTPPHEKFDLGLSIPQSGAHETVLQTYSQPPEELDIGLSIPQSGTHEDVLHTYTQPPEAFNVGLSLPLSGTHEVVLITYSNALPDEMNLGLSIPQSGTLT